MTTQDQGRRTDSSAQDVGPGLADHNSMCIGPAVDIQTIKAKLSRTHGQQYWRSLEELAETKQFKEMLQREFPPGATEWWNGLSRRNFLKMAAASLALAGVTSCTKQPPKEILPYVNQPENLVPGEALFYATAMVMGGFATGVLVKNREGHPIKIEGNPEHPSSLGHSNVWIQASIMDLYDPDRSQAVTNEGEISTWEQFLSALNELMQEQRTGKGAGWRFLTETSTSPTLAWQLRGLLKRFPEARWHQYEPTSRDNVKEGARLAFGELVEAHYRFEQAAVVVSLESDFLYTHPERLRYTRQFTDGRRLAGGKRVMNRLYVTESSPTVTGSMADERLPVTSEEVSKLALVLAQEIGIQVEPGRQAAENLSAAASEWLSGVVQDLKKHPGESVVVAGEYQPPLVHALTHAINERLGNHQNTVYYMESAETEPLNQLESVRELVQEMKNGKVNTLFILGGNPVYTAPCELEFGEAMKQVKLSTHLGVEQNETAKLCTWHIPQAHYLESWGDARAFDGTVSILQPLIAPLYNGKTAHELLGAMVQQQPVRSDYEVVREFWLNQNIWADFEKGWRKALHDGGIAGTAARVMQVSVKMNRLNKAVSDKLSGINNAIGGPNSRKMEYASDLELNFRPDPGIWDGRFANNGWLQECPKPISKITWDNAALVSPALAGRKKLNSGDVIELAVGDKKIQAPVWVMPGQAENSVTVHLGYGRARVGRIGSGVGFDAYRLRSSGAFWTSSGLKFAKVNSRHEFAATQNHHVIDNAERQVYRAGTLEEFLAKPDFVKHSVEAPEREETLYEPDEYPEADHQWGMSIDLTTCIGCNACLIACEVENNIPVVGKDQVARHREMFWIRVDTYYRGSLENPEFNHMPVPCMHCEHAPCELVCPVAATVHDHEGLNLQVYNRCVGTRFCSNNCPYKVRRFNFYQYTDYHQPSYKPMYNPEVTVRWRGVMEKCTYCIQRISHARIAAEKENRRIRDGEIQTACQQACPADAIIFGDLKDRNSRIVALKGHPLDYPMLGQLNTRPRTTYLAKISNPNGNASRI